MAVKSCKCKFCCRHTLISKTIRRGTRKDLVELLKETHENLSQIEEDLAYYKAIMSGDWPSSVEQLEKALSRAKEKRMVLVKKPQIAEFCLFCGAGIGKFRRVGEGTCEKCDKQ